MTTLTVTAKGQITLRRELLQHLGIVPGEKLVVAKLTHGVVALHVKKQGLDSFIGCLPPPSKALSIEEINHVISDAWAGKNEDHP